MSRKIRVLAASLLGLSLAGTVLAEEKTPAYSVVRGEAALVDARMRPNSTGKVGPLVMAERARAQKQLRDLIAEAKAGKAVDPGAIDALIDAVGR